MQASQTILDEGPIGRRRPRVLPDVTARLASEILTGQRQSGDTLPREADLAAAYGVSRTVIREALKTLAAKGLVQIRSRIGTTISDPDLWNIIDAQVMEWHGAGALDQRMQDAIMETRWAIEPLVSELAAERATLQEIADLEAAWRGMAESGDDVAAFTRSDIEFHRIVYGTSHNPVFRQIGNLIDAALRSTLEISATYSADQRASAIRVHGALVEALRLRDPKAARASAEAILTLSSRDLAAAKSQKS